MFYNMRHCVMVLVKFKIQSRVHWIADDDSNIPSSFKVLKNLHHSFKWSQRWLLFPASWYSATWNLRPNSRPYMPIYRSKSTHMASCKLVRRSSRMHPCQEIIGQLTFRLLISVTVIFCLRYCAKGSRSSPPNCKYQVCSPSIIERAELSSGKGDGPVLKRSEPLRHIDM